MMTSIFLSLLSVVLEDLWRGKLGFGFGMRVMRELCKKMRSETVLIGKERKLGGSPAGVNFALVTTDVSTAVPEPMPVKQQQNMLN
ncbi:unnamed protein product [Sphagnum troendelagicum]